MEPPYIVVLGGINIDLVTMTPRFPEAGETVVGTGFLTYPGGKGANKAVTAARMGGRVKMIGRVGGDAFGGQLVESLTGTRVDVSGVLVDDAVTSGVAVINIDGRAQNRIIQVHGANARCDITEAQRVGKAISGASALMLQLEVPVEVSLSAAQQAADSGVLIIMDPGPVRSMPDEMYQLCDYLTPNETEAQALVGFPVTGPNSASKAAAALMERGVDHVVIKLGALGAYYATTGIERFLSAPKVEAMDSVAAGDAFNGALAAMLAEGQPTDEALKWAMASGALAVTHHGAQDAMPHRQQVEKLLAGGQL